MLSKIQVAMGAGIAIVLAVGFYQNQTDQQSVAIPTTSSDEQNKLEQWTYSEIKDEMRGTSTKVASVNAMGEGDTAAILSVRKIDGSGYILIDSSYSRLAPSLRCFSGIITVKFDDHPPQKTWCKMVGLSIGINPGFYKKLVASKITQVELETNELSTIQYKFATGNLKL